MELVSPGRWFGVNRDSPQALGLLAWWTALGSPIGPLRDEASFFSASLQGNAYVGPDPEFGLALQCDGNGDYADAGTPSAITGLLSNYTVSAWAKFTGSFTNYRDVLYLGNAVAGQQGIIVDNGGVWYAQFGDGAGVSGGTLSLGPWYHLAYTFQGGPSSGTARTYLNGVLQTTSTVSNFTRTGSNFTIGADAFNSRWLQGAVADVRVHNFPLPGQVIYQEWAPETRFDLYDIDEEALAMAIADAPPAVAAAWRNSRWWNWGRRR